MPSDITEILNDLHDKLADKYLKIVQSDEASPADLRNINSFLKDNGIDLQTRKITKLSDALQDEDIPFQDEETGT